MLLVAPAFAGAATRAQQEAAFLRSVDARDTVHVVTGDLTTAVGKHVAYRCEIASIVRPGVIIGQCGGDAEPASLFVRMPTSGVRVGDRVRVLGVVERPGSWSDVTGHTVYYAFLRAVFVDRL